jgi:hypothetical protein
MPIAGWQRCAHEAASFESRGEFHAACLLDSAQSVQWWLRNDPAVLRIPTPAGMFGPDFLYAAKRNGVVVMGLLEIKGEIFWNGEDSEARVKAGAARAWVKAIMNANVSQSWEFAVVLEQDACDATSLEGMIASAEERAP